MTQIPLDKLESILDRSSELEKSLSSELSSEDYVKFSKEYSEIEPLKNAIVDWKKFQAESEELNDIINGVKNDVVLRDGDQLNIPRNTQSVSVLGEVYVPTTHIYESNLIFNDYLSLSGGATKLGDPNQVFIIKANGVIFLFSPV